MPYKSLTQVAHFLTTIFCIFHTLLIYFDTDL